MFIFSAHREFSDHFSWSSTCTLKCDSNKKKLSSRLLGVNSQQLFKMLFYRKGLKSRAKSRSSKYMTYHKTLRHQDFDSTQFALSTLRHKNSKFESTRSGVCDGGAGGAYQDYHEMESKKRKEKQMHFENYPLLEGYKLSLLWLAEPQLELRAIVLTVKKKEGCWYLAHCFLKNRLFVKTAGAFQDGWWASKYHMVKNVHVLFQLFWEVSQQQPPLSSHWDEMKIHHTVKNSLPSFSQSVSLHPFSHSIRFSVMYMQEKVKGNSEIKCSCAILSLSLISVRLLLNSSLC